ncbi:MAG: hypothetical protein ACTSQI_10530 [Candidatus Helarchaeota archaeon]
MLNKYVLPFIGGTHPFAQADLEGIEVAAVLMDAAEEKKKKERFIGIYKTYLPLWVISINESNGIMVEALILNSDYIRMRRFDKAIELDPDRDLAAGSISDFHAKLKLFESKINSYQKEARFELNGYLNPVVASEIRELFQTLDQGDISDALIMSQRLSEQGAILMCEPLISIFHVNVQKILSDLYQIPIIVNAQLAQLYNELGNTVSEFVNKVRDLKYNAGSLENVESYEKQHRKAETLTHELMSFRDAKDRAINKLQKQADQINYLNKKVQEGYLNLLSSVYQTKGQIMELATKLTKTYQRGQAISVLMPIYLAIFHEKKNRVVYFTPYLLDFNKKKELIRTKGFDSLKRSFEHNYSKKLPPGIYESEEYNILFKPNTQQLFNDGVHKLRETKIISSKTYIKIMDTYNEFFRQARPPPKTRL